MWLEKATSLLSELTQHENAEPFLEPVDIEQYAVSFVCCLNFTVYRINYLVKLILDIML